MSITDELRKYAGRLSDEAARKSEHGFSPVAMALEGIADRIDAEHESAMYDMRREHDEWAADRDAHWVKLPVDADGECIHAGDVLDGYGKTIEVVELRHGRSGWLLISRDGNGYDDTFVFTHHHEPTVEDVLRDVVTLCHNTWKEESPFHFYDVDDVMKSGNIAEFISRLRLAEEGE